MRNIDIEKRLDKMLRQDKYAKFDALISVLKGQVANLISDYAEVNNINVEINQYGNKYRMSIIAIVDNISSPNILD